jgi:hypothetical protein
LLDEQVPDLAFGLVGEAGVPRERDCHSHRLPRPTVKRGPELSIPDTLGRSEEKGRNAVATTFDAITTPVTNQADTNRPTIACICCRWSPPDSDAITVARSLHLFEFDAGGGARCLTLHTCHVVC